MLEPYGLLDKVVEYGKIQSEKNRLIINKTDLWDYVIKVDPRVKKESLGEVIAELDTRGWLLENDENEIKFDPATFQ